MQFLKLILVAGAFGLAGLTPAYPAGVCQSLITSWLGYDQPPPQSLERSFDELMDHLDYGTLETGSQGQLLIKSGVHTYAALMRVLESHGKSSRSLRKKSVSLDPLTGKSVRLEVLDLGVLRVQMGEELWASEIARDNARVTTAPEQTYRGIKTIFPKSMSSESVRSVMEDFYWIIYKTALASELTSPHYSVEDCFDSPDPEIPPMRLKMVLSYGRPVSFFPTWIQQSCY